MSRALLDVGSGSHSRLCRHLLPEPWLLHWQALPVSGGSGDKGVRCVRVIQRTCICRRSQSGGPAVSLSIPPISVLCSRCAGKRGAGCNSCARDSGIRAGRPAFLHSSSDSWPVRLSEEYLRAGQTVFCRGACKALLHTEGQQCCDTA